jgi:xanthine/uracil/vitamin C permease (AzgA family)
MQATVTVALLVKPENPSSGAKMPVMINKAIMMMAVVSTVKVSRIKRKMPARMIIPDISMLYSWSICSGIIPR